MRIGSLDVSQAIPETDGEHRSGGKHKAARYAVCRNRSTLGCPFGVRRIKNLSTTTNTSVSGEVRRMNSARFTLSYVRYQNHCFPLQGFLSSIMPSPLVIRRNNRNPRNNA
jgi:hypothetical protein